MFHLILFKLGDLRSMLVIWSSDSQQTQMQRNAQVYM